VELAPGASRLPIRRSSGFGESEGLAGGTGGAGRLFRGLVCFARLVLAGSNCGGDLRGNHGHLRRLAQERLASSRA
jgi:hypothetical protein